MTLLCFDNKHGFPLRGLVADAVKDAVETAILKSMPEPAVTPVTPESLWWSLFMAFDDKLFTFVIFPPLIIAYPSVRVVALKLSVENEFVNIVFAVNESQLMTPSLI